MASPRNAGARPTVLAGAGFALLLSLAFWPIVAGSRSFFHWDLRYEVVPLWEVSAIAIRSGQWPFWIDGEYCGHPALFRQEVALFYPLTLPLLATDAPPHRLADLFSLFHLWLAGFAAYLLVCDLTSSQPAAVFGGVAWMLSARLVQSAQWPNAVAVSALLPFVFLGMFRIGRGRRRSGVLSAAIAGGLALLAFRPQVLVGAAPVIVAVAVAAIAAAPSRARAMRDLAVAALLAAAIGAPALVPSAALYPLTSRAGGLTRADRDVRPITFHRDLDQVFLPVDGARRWPEVPAYPGALAGLLFLAGIVLAARGVPGFPRGLFLALALGGAVGLVFAFGERGPYGLFAGLPVLRDFRIPARYLVSWSLAVAIGSALTAAHLFAGSSRRRRSFGAAAVVLLGADLVWHARSAALTAPAAFYETEPAILAALRERLSLDEAGFPRRFWPLARQPALVAYSDEEKVAAARELEPITFGLGMRYGLESVLGHGPTLRRSDVLFQKPTDRAADLGGVGVFVTAGPSPSGNVPGRPALQDFSALPRAILVPEAIAIPASRAVAAAFDPAFDPRRAALLEANVTLAPDARWVASEAAVRLASRESGRIELDASAPAPAVLVLFNSFERGWRAFVDGTESPVYRADAAFLGTPVPAGRHRIRFEYRPRGLREGLALAAAGLLGLLLATLKLPAEAA